MVCPGLLICLNLRVTEGAVFFILWLFIASIGYSAAGVSCLLIVAILIVRGPLGPYFALRASLGPFLSYIIY